MIKIIWSIRARKEFDKVYQYWTSHNKSNTYSEKVLNETLRMINLLRNQNKIGLKSNVKELRRVLILENFSLSYRISKKEIRILSFFDNRQNPRKNKFN
ncbi:type II toxin-antitoxin system RelE/ParE family toxin [Chryseobacterium aahli]|uniref:type II toxin-antitoxin system RelE/ParE family toxin n=1 Tax=Chryseobacterium aahli TaxID=1278643 RepID=UPI001F60B022|nr:type II toxin-antitoxin system RelE/ParE family toxin [Chryseobacterium aahli]MCI3939377.1 type II toxin-antitoxin system RelE/ParE family toxin [Chryseobacterium aahli]